MDVRLSPVCGLITDRPLNKDSGGFQFARPPTLGVTHHTHYKRRYQCLNSIIRIVFLLLNTCGMRPRRSNKKHLDSQTATEFENIFVWDELRGIVPADIIVGTQQTKCVAECEQNAASFYTSVLTTDSQSLSTHLTEMSPRVADLSGAQNEHSSVENQQSGEGI